MGRYDSVTREVDESRGGKSTAAFFDFDGTLLAGYSVTSFMKRRIMSGKMPPREALEQLFTIVSHSVGKIEFEDVLEQSASALEGVRDDTMRELAQRVFEKDLSVDLYPESRALVEAHLAKGHTVVLVSSATQYQVEAAAAEIGIDHVLCTRLEVDDGVLSGRIVPPAVYGHGKLVAASAFAARHRIDLKKSFFYSDGAEDLPLLEAVGHPRPLNPGKGLQAIAEQEGWPVRTFSSRGTPGISEVVRTSLVYGSLIPSFMSALPAWFLNRSKRGVVNQAISIWGEFGSAVAGLDVSVSGEKHLWSHRPAVFIFNHQSSTDALIVARLLRRDFTGVAKAEMQSNPLVGPVLAAVGTVFIDRGDKGQAVEALKPAVESLQNGTSIALAPEGSRSLTNKLGTFKKGAFHIALQAGVPIVPIVIANSSDALPKNGFFIRPAKIDVTVLPPVSTTGWQAETVDQHVGDVRKMFLDTLGQSTRSQRQLRRVK